MFELTQDRIYILVFALVVIGITGFLVSNYIKSCVQTEIAEMKKERKESSKKKRKMLDRKRMYDLMMQERQAQMAQISQHEGGEPMQPDMESYVDPVGKRSNEPTAYNGMNGPTGSSPFGSS